MPRKRKNSNRPEELVAGKARKAYSGERLERLRHVAERKIHLELQGLRDEIYELNQQAARAVRIKASSKKWLSKTERAQLDISILRIQLKLLDRDKLFYSTYLSLYRKFGGLVKFNPKRVQRTKEYLPETIYEINERTKILVKAVRLQRERASKWKKFFDALKLNVSRDQALSVQRKQLRLEVKQKKAESARAMESTTETLKALYELHKVGLMRDSKYDREHKKTVLAFNRKVLELASAEEALWIFWSHAPQNFPHLVVPRFASEELARRRHNATEEKRKRMKLIERLS